MKNKIVAIIVIFGLVSCVSAQKQLLTPTITNSPIASSTLPTLTKNNETQTSGEEVILGFAISNDETQLAVYNNKEVYIYNLKNRKKVVIKRFESANYYERSSSVAFNPEGTQIAITGKLADEPIEIWDIKQQKLIATLSSIPQGYWVSKIEFNPNGEKILARLVSPCKSDNDSVKLALFSVNGDNNWANSDLFSFEIHCSDVFNTRFTKNNKLFVFTRDLITPTLVFDANTGQYISKIPAPTGELRFYYDVSSDGKTMVGTSFENYSFLVNTETMKETKVNGTILLSNDENRFVTGDPAPSHWYLSENNKVKCSYAEIYANPIFWQATLSAEKNLLVTFYPNGKGFRIWNVANCEIVYTLTIE